MHRRASVLLIAIAITTVCITLAFGYLASVRAVLPGAAQGNYTRLARAAATMGVSHAMAALVDGYCRSPNLPTNYRQRAFAGFRPIDSDKVGWWTPTLTDNRPWGMENTPEDVNGNDVPAAETLTESYLLYKGQALDRVGIHSNGFLRCSPLGRWIEPGAVDADLVANPVSFHLNHPVAANTASPDPAVKAGEPWTPPASQPGASWFDAELRPVASRSLARYRLRYALTIEDLAGHLLINLPGAHTPPTRSAAAGQTPLAADAWGVVELDQPVIERWRDCFGALVMSRQDSEAYWPLLAQFQGLGMTSESWQPGTQNGCDALHSIVGDVPQVLTDYDRTNPPPAGEPDGVYATLARPSLGWGDTIVSLRAAMRGPLLDIEQLGTVKYGGDHWYAYTPYGRGSRLSATPSAWDEAPTDCPWRLNVPTMTLEAIYDMVYAFLPVEARTYKYQQQQIDDYDGKDAAGWPKWKNVSNGPISPGLDVVVTGSRLRDAPMVKPLFDGRRPVPAQPYPGMSPLGGTVPASGPQWRNDLGVMLSGGQDTSVSITQFNKCKPIHGQSIEYFRPGPWQITIKEQPVVGGQRIIMRPGNANFYWLAPNQAYTYPGSYWWDVGVALLQTFGTAMHAWHGETGASHAAAPTAGLPLWPAGHRLSTQPPTAAPAAAAPILDLDADGDGVAESPGLLNSVEEMDRLFICNMGEWWGDFATGTRPTTPAPGLFIELDRTGDGFTHWNTAVPRRRAFATDNVPAANIAGLLAATTITIDEARNMELVLNDTRLSFFGSSPQYPGFQGIDFDGDGTVWCVGYANGNAPADPGTGKARRLAPASGDQHVCLTGYVVFQQSRFFRVWTRGELYDELLGRPVAKAELDTVMTIDPNGSLYDVNGAPTTSWNADPAQCTGLGDSQILWQRWLRSLDMRPTAAAAP